MTRFKKGFSGNPESRMKGKPNKATAEMRQRISDFLSDKWGQIMDDFKQLEPKERVTLFERLLQYCIPRMQSTEIDLLERLTDEQIDQIILRLKEETNGK